MPTPRLLLAVAAASLLAACGNAVAVGAGGACGPSRGCAEGLTCASGTCVAVGGTSDGGTATDGGAVADGGTSPDGGTASDGGTVPDGGTASDGGPATDGGTTCGPCDTPPDACHGTQGTCVNGACVYPVVDGATCDDGDPCTVQDTCTAGVCAGTPMVCNTPPAPACLSGTELSTYDQTGVCQSGRCTYTRKTITCGSGGCVNNACQTDPCASMSCNTPPSICYGSAGTCSAGSCTYPYADGVTCDDHDPCTTNDQCNTGVCKGTPMACDTPPASTCQNASTAKIYAPAGTCSAGTCSYTYTFVTCATGCANGACNPSGWTTMVSNVTQDLTAVWGSSASDVWAVGNKGTMVHWDGTTWKAVVSGTISPIVDVDGTGANNVYALANNGAGLLLHNDGTGWKPAGGNGLPLAGDSPMAIHVLSATDVIAGGFAYSYSTDPALIEWKSGTATSLASVQADLYNSFVGLWAFSATDVDFACSYLYHWDGTTLGQNQSLGGAQAIWAESATSIFVSEGGNVAHYDGTTWLPLATGFNGTVTDLTGTATNRVFASGYANTSANVVPGAVLAWDGSGWTQATLPAGTGELDGIWAAPDGEVFAVGKGGTIVHGP